MIQNKNYKYKREMPEIVKQKILAKLRGRSKSPFHCQAISDGLKQAWSQVPKNVDEQN